MFKPLRKISATPQVIQRSSLPETLNISFQSPLDPLKAGPLGYHTYMNKIYDKELAGVAMIADVEALPDTLFPEKSFPMKLEKFLGACVAQGLYDASQKRWLVPDFSAPSQELPAADFLTKIRKCAFNSLTPNQRKKLDNSRYWTAAFRNNALPGGFTERKPDVIELLEVLEQTWRAAVSDVQLKSGEKETTPAFRQLHDGALNSFSAQDGRLFHIGLALIRKRLFLAYYDRCGCIRSPPIDIHKDPCNFLRIILGASFLPLERLGWDMSIKERGETRVVTVNRVDYTIINCIYHDISIRGIGTIVWLAGPSSDPRVVVAVKNSWVDTSRTLTEVDVLKMAADKQIRNVPLVLAYETVQKRVGKKMEDVSTATIRDQTHLGELTKDLEVRHYRRVVLSTYGTPLGDFTSRSELLFGLLCGVEAHKNVYEKCGIIHGNINDKTVRLGDTIDGNTGLRCGSLVGFEFAFRKGERPTVAKGLESCSAPYMSIELLTRAAYVYAELQHDFEPFFYVLFFVCCLQDGPHGSMRSDLNIMESDLGAWLSNDMKAVGRAKKDVMLIQRKDIFANFMDEHVHSYFEELKPVLWELRMAVVREDPPTNHQEIIQILRTHLDVQIAKDFAQEEPGDSYDGADESGDLADIAIPETNENVREPGEISAATGASGSAEAGPSQQVGELLVRAQAARLADEIYAAQAAVPAEQNAASGGNKRQRASQRIAEQARDPQAPSPYLFPCKCGKGVRQGQLGLIECTKLGCKSRFHHRGCVEESLGYRPDNQWICEDCTEKRKSTHKKTLNPVVPHVAGTRRKNKTVG
ncbi:hypothetical protein K523DRAFT_234680 [Schizophyllum commune Tattone D]|nr:hypothetical protein K523DRAFT_234680 [Schizophyllum commune Tattone D]